MIAQLIPEDGARPIPVTRDVTIVGRKRSVCDVLLNDASVSKLHCSIAKTDGLLFIRDLGSTNGTRVNGQRVTRGALLPGDELAFGNLKFRVHLGPGEPDVGHDERTEMITSLPDVGGADVDFVGADSDSDVRLLPDDSEVDLAST